MTRPAARDNITTLRLRAGAFSTVVILLAGCGGGSQPPLETPVQATTSQQMLGRQAYHILHPFGRSPNDGTQPVAGLIDVGGKLYGTTATGGSNGGGAVFSITTGGKEVVLHSFGGSQQGDGKNPFARLVYINGMLYGTTVTGGAYGAGTVFSISLGGKEKLLHSFDFNDSDPQGGGYYPQSGLTYDNGKLYGTTVQGGIYVCKGNAYFCGTVYSITTSGNFHVLYNFGKKANDGANSVAALLNVDGLLYGTTTLGGKYNQGTVFSITTSGTERTVYDFGTNLNDGSSPTSAVIDVQGKLYGTTSEGGSAGRGTVFAVTPQGTESVLFGFDGSNGSEPNADLKNVRGLLYGTTTLGGTQNSGTIFRITNTGAQKVLHSFGEGTGTQPRAGLAAISHTLYGTTLGDGPKSLGNVYSLKP
jgi:uncharacterized repeat protein (TIGR03803 family)